MHKRQQRPGLRHMLQEVVQCPQEVGYLDCSCSPSEDRTPAPVSQSGYLAAVVLDFLSSSLLLSLSASAVILNLACPPLVPSSSLRHHSLLLPHSLSPSPSPCRCLLTLAFFFCRFIYRSAQTTITKFRCQPSYLCSVCCCCCWCVFVCLCAPVYVLPAPGSHSSWSCFSTKLPTRWQHGNVYDHQVALCLPLVSVLTMCFSAL